MTAFVRRGLGILIAFAVTAVARGQSTQTIARHVPAAPDPAHVFVLDSAHLLSAGTIAALQDSSRALQTETGADVAWVTLPTLGGRAIEEAALFIGRTWRIGSAGQPGEPLRNRGLVILYVPDKTKTAGPNFRVEVGNGLEGTITDSRSRTISAAMRDDLRAKRYDAAYMTGWKVAASLVREDFASRATRAAEAPLEAGAKSSGAAKWIVLAAVLGISIVIVFALVVTARGRARRQKRGSNHRDARDDGVKKRRRQPATIPTLPPVIASDSSDGGSAWNSGGGFGGGGGFSGGGSSDTI